jgi:asparagine synthase (glutamine-hydrolysing)
MEVIIAILDKRGCNAAEKVLDVIDFLDFGLPSRIELILPKESSSGKNSEIIMKKGFKSSTAVGIVTSKSKATNDYEHLQLDDASILFAGKVYSPALKSAVMAQVAKAPNHCEAVLQTFIEQTDGDYLFSMIRDGWIAAGRDPVGVQPLYFGENKDIAVFATNRKMFWKLGIETPQSFPPGNLGFAESEGFKFKPVKTLVYAEPKSMAINDAAKNLQILLEQSIRRRVQGLEKVCVAFSGGLDSSVIAFLASKLGVKVDLIHVSLENQPETEEAIEGAEALDLPLQVHLFKESDVEKTLPMVVDLIEEADPVKASIGVPFYWVAEKAAEAGFKVMLAGQGADELFGGYQRYVKEYCKAGEQVLETMFGDVVKLYESNLERDLKITGFFDVELRLPFGAFEIAEYALSLPLECKFEQKPDTLRKLVLRKLALNVGVPRSIAKKPKKAVQYSTGINDAVKHIAKKQQKTFNEYVSELFLKSKQAFYTSPNKGQSLG